MADDLVARLRTVGQAAFTSSMHAAAASVRSVDDATNRSAGSFLQAAKNSDVLQNSLAAVATAAKWTGIAVAGAMAVGIYQGVKFNASMEQQRVAFTSFLGSAKAANVYLAQLWKLAATTPFQFQDVVAGSRTLIGFGMSAKDAMVTLRGLSNAISATGASADQIRLATMALGQIQARGKLASQDFYQLTSAGVTSAARMAKAYHVTGGAFMQAMQNGQITSQSFLDHLRKSWAQDPMYKGAAAKQARTFNGQLSTLHDTVQQLAGTLTGPLFNALERRVLPAINHVVGAVGRWAQHGGMQSLMSAVTSGLHGQGVTTRGGDMGGPGTAGPASGINGFANRAAQLVGRIGGDVAGFGKQFITALAPAMPFLRNILLPLLEGVAKGIIGAFVASIPVIRVFANVLGFVGRAAAPLRGVIEVIGEVIGFVLGPAILRAAGELSKLGWVFKIIGAPVRIADGLFRGVVRTLGSLIGRFRGVLKAAAGFGLSLVKHIAAGIAAGPRFLLNAIEKALTKAYSKLPGPLRGIVHGVLGVLGHLAGGGNVMRSGPYLVGERGPEVVNLNAGDHVTPNARLRSGPMPTNQMALTFEIPLTIGQREFGRAVARVTAQDLARSG